MLKRLKLKLLKQNEKPAAFGRLCVETARQALWLFLVCQPPSGGCVLKRMGCSVEKTARPQPPSGGCVLKLTME